MTTPDRRIFVAGATGATGSTLFANHDDEHLVPHVRPQTAAKGGAHPRAAVVDLADVDRLAEVLSGCTTVVQLIGTMQKRFSTGDTYETSDIGTTRQLVDAAKRTPVDHFVLLSSVGAGRPIGAYLKAKAEAERIVTDSGIPWTIFRPSAFDGGGHQAPPLMGSITKALGMDKYRPIPIEDLARTLFQVAERRAPLNTILEGTALWDLVG